MKVNWNILEVFMKSLESVIYNHLYYIISFKGFILIFLHIVFPIKSNTVVNN